MPVGFFRFLGFSLLIGLLGTPAPGLARLSVQETSAAVDFSSPVVRELKSGEKHNYPITFKANDYVKVVVDQKGIDVVVRLVGPDGKILVERDNPPLGNQGQERLLFVAEQPGRYNLEIEAAKKNVKPGTYELKVDALKPASETDRAQVEIERLNVEADKLRQAGKYDQGVALAWQAVEKGEKALGPEHPLLADSLNFLGLLYRAKGDYRQAGPVYRRSLGIREKALGPDHPDVAVSLNNLALIYKNEGDYTKAEPLYQRAITILEKTVGPDHPNVATGLNNLANLYLVKGDYVRAEPLYRRSLAILEKTLGADQQIVAMSMHNLANMYRANNDYGQAEPIYYRVLAMQEKVLGPEHPDVALTLKNLAGMYRTKSEYAKAEPLYQRSLAIREKNLGPDHPDVGDTLFQLALLYQAQGDWVRAESFSRRALAIREKALGPDHPEVAKNLHQLAALALVQGDVNRAVTFQARGNEASERDLMRNLVAGSERQKLLYLNQTAATTDRTLSLNLQGAPASPAARQAALTVLLRRKGRALDALTSSIETLRRQQTAETRKLLDDYASLASQISALTLRGPGKQKPEIHLAAIRALEEQKEKLENEIGQRSKEFQAQIVPISLNGIQQQLPVDAVLLEYAVYRPYDAKTDSFGPARYAAYTLNAQGTINVADLGETGLIERSVTRFRQVLSNPRSKNVKAAAQALERLVLAPVRGFLGKAEQVLVSPDGSLSLIPFAALQDGKGTYLTEQYRLTYLTSGRDLLRLAFKIESRTPPLVLADPDYAEGRGPVLVGQQYAPLPRLMGTIYEGAALKVLFPTANLKMEAAATAQAVKSVQRPILLHIATHGYFLDDVVKSEVRTDERILVREDSGADTEKLTVENPLLRAWLFFAGANRSNSEAENGTLTALEAAQLDLWGTKLVTLSACKTGVGEAKNGDGVYGLRRALVLAGSEAQMMSLWSVSDQATRELMVDYYNRLKDGEGRSDALRNAQLSMLKDPKRQHPYYWAAFIQSGEWATLAGDRENSKN